MRHLIHVRHAVVHDGQRLHRRQVGTYKRLTKATKKEEKKQTGDNVTYQFSAKRDSFSVKFK
jgi:hypothetical protein